MAQRAGLAKQAVIQEAVALADTVGLEAVSLGMLAERLGVRSPSLYHYFPQGIAGLRHELALWCMRDQADQLGKVVMGKARADAIWALAEEYRAYIKAHPGLYAATMRAMIQDAPDLREAQTAILEIAQRALDGYHLAPDDAIHAIRICRIIAHGAATLELGGSFGMPQDVDETFRRAVEMLLRELEHSSVRTTS